MASIDGEVTVTGPGVDIYQLWCKRIIVGDTAYALYSYNPAKVVPLWNKRELHTETFYFSHVSKTGVPTAATFTHEQFKKAFPKYAEEILLALTTALL